MKAFDQLLDYDIKPSAQRIAIMEYLLTHRTHPTADEIYTALSPSMPTLSKTTVYNTLRLFTEHGAALMLTIDDRKVCFDGDTSPHAHFLCKHCLRVYDLPLPNAVELIGNVSSYGHAITEAHVYYRGVCNDCLRELKID